MPTPPRPPGHTHAKAHEQAHEPARPTPQRPPARAFGMALAVHALLIIVLALGLTWNTEAQGPVQVELWGWVIAPPFRARI